MKIALTYHAALGDALDAARAEAQALAQASRRAEIAFERARSEGGDVQALAERFRAAHRAHMEAHAEVAEIEAALEGAALAA